MEGLSDDCESVCFVENLGGFAHPLCSVATWGQGTAHCHDSFQTHLSAGRKTGENKSMKAGRVRAMTVNNGTDKCFHALHLLLS